MKILDFIQFGGPLALDELNLSLQKAHGFEDVSGADLLGVSLTRIHRGGRSWGGFEGVRRCSLVSGIMVLKQETDPRKGAPNSNCVGCQEE